MAAVQSILEQAPEKFTVVTFHLLRVEIKRLKSLFSLIGGLSKDFNKKTAFESFGIFFKQAGKVRELQIEDLFLVKYADYTVIKAYRNRLHEKELEEKRIFFDLQERLDKSLFDITYKEVDSFLKNLSEQQVAGYLDKKRKRLWKMFMQLPLQEEKMHQVRKELKQIVFIEKMCGLEWDKVRSGYEINLSNLLGKWHDQLVIVQHIENIIRSLENNHEDTLVLKKINGRIYSKISLLADKINEQVAELRRI